MPFFILGDPIDKKYPYLGTYRTGPSHVDSHDDDQDINKLWYWYIGKEFADGLNDSDLNQACLLISKYKELGQSFDIVELAEHRDSLTKGDFLGYDLSFKSHQSMLSWGLKFTSSGSENGKEFLPIFRLVEEYFRPKLNKHGLFDEYGIASFLLDV